MYFNSLLGKNFLIFLLFKFMSQLTYTVSNKIQKLY